jgi:hypothetical protein
MLDNDIIIGNNSIFVNANIEPLNQSALLRFYFLGDNFTGIPQFSENGIAYSDCTALTNPACTDFNFYVDGSGLFQARFNVTHFSFYRTGQSAPTPPSTAGDMAFGWASLMVAGAFFTLVGGMIFSLFRRK